MKNSRLACALLALIAPFTAPASEGTHDLSFGTQGFAYVEAIHYANALTIDSDGRLVTSGLIAYPRGVIARRMPDGSNDTTFGTNGGLTLNVESLGLESTSQNSTMHVAIPGGGYYARTSARRTSNLWEVSAIIRITSAGAFDPTYGTNGVVVEIPGVVWLTIDPDGKPVAFGSPLGGSPLNLPSPYLLRLPATGSRDPAFNGGNPTLFPNLTTAHHLIRAADGSYYVVGHIRLSSAPEQVTIGVAHVFANGVRDTAFGSNGVVVLPFGVGSVIWDMPSTLAQQADGKILVVGYSGYTSPETAPTRCVVARLNPDGTLDSSFAAGGKLVYAHEARNSSCDVAVVSDTGRILLSGRNKQPGDSPKSFLLALNTADGSVDSRYGINGVGALPGDLNTEIARESLVLDRQQRAVSFGSNIFGDAQLYRLTSDLIFTDPFDSP